MDDSEATVSAAEPLPGGRTLGVETKPRALLSWDGPEYDRIVEVLALHAPTIKEVRSLREVRQDDYDLLVTNRMTQVLSTDNGGISREAADHLCVISFSASFWNENWGWADAFAPPRAVGIRWRSGFLAKSVEVPDDLLNAVADLVGDDLAPSALARASHIYYQPDGWVHSRHSLAGLTGTRRPEDPPEIHPFLRTDGLDARTLAGWYVRSPCSEGWILPPDLKRPWDWVAAAIRHWAITYRRFPLVGGWWEDSKWQTIAESDAAATKAALKTELASVIVRLEREIITATAVLEEAARDADSGPRRLLTEKGEPLKDASAEALVKLGFKVIDRDEEEPPDEGGKIEDLGAVDPSDPVADPIIEVKGYDNGAKAGDFGSMMRHLVRAIHAGRSPTAIWWIANQWRKRSPDERGPVLAGEDAMIAEHASADVPLVVIDTRDLFQAVRAVEDGRITPGDARAALRAARGRWEGVSSYRRQPTG